MVSLVLALHNLRSHLKDELTCPGVFIKSKIERRNFSASEYSLLSTYILHAQLKKLRYTIMTNFNIKFTLILLSYYNFKILNFTLSNIQLIINTLFNTQSIPF